MNNQAKRNLESSYLQRGECKQFRWKGWKLIAIRENGYEPIKRSKIHRSRKIWRTANTPGHTTNVLRQTLEEIAANAQRLQLRKRIQIWR